MLYLLYRIGRFIALSLSLKLTYRLADILGSLYYLLAKKDRKIATNNIKVVLNQRNNTLQVRHTCRMVFTNFARYLLEFLCAAKIDLKYIEKNVRIIGRKNLDRALKLGRGVLLVGAHLGNWELGAMVLSMLGYKVNIVAWTHKNRQINDFFLQQRQSKGLKVIPLGTSIRRVFSALKNNEIVALLGDIDYAQPEVGITVKFFRRDTIIPRGPAVFSLKTTCPVVPTFLLREKGNRFRLIFEESIMCKPLKNQEYSLRSLTQELARTIESYVAQYPGQWFMLTPRWPTQP